MVKFLQVVFVFLLVIVSFRFFDARFLNESFTNYFVLIYVLFAIALSIPYVLRSPMGFIFPVQLIILSTLISIFMAKISWNQSFMDSLIITVPLMLWFFFFYLLHIKISIRIIEGIILFYGILYVIIFFYQSVNNQTVLFGNSEFMEGRGVVRIIIAGGGIFFLSSFIAINKLTTQKKGRWLWISFSILGIVIPLLQATRQFIAGVLLIFLYHFIKDFSPLRKLIITACFVLFISYLFTTSDNTIIKGIIEAQEETSQLGKEYIRVLSGTYFLTEFSPDNVSKVLGNGVPYEGISDYGKFVEDLYNLNFFLSDVGIIAMYVMFGILSVIAYILIWVRSFTLSVPEEYHYLKYYLWFLLATSLTSDHVYSYDYLISTVFVLYIYQVKFEEETLSP